MNQSHRFQGLSKGLAVGIATALWLPTWFSASLNSHDAMRLAQLGLSAFASLCLLIQTWASRKHNTAHSAERDVLPIALLLLAIASALASAHPAVSFQDLALHLGVIATALAVADADSPALRHWFNRALAVTPLWLAGMTAAIYIAALSMEQPLNARHLHLGFANPRFLNHAQTLFVPWLVVVFVANETRSGLRWLALIAAGFHVGLAYLDVARGTGLSWLAVLFILLLAGARAEARRFAAVLLGGLLFGVLAFDLLPALLSRHWDAPFASASEFGRAHSRDALWSQALAMIEASPWLGKGGMEFAALADARAAHPHNIYLQWAAEYGIPAALLAGIVLIKPVITELRTNIRDTRRIALAAICVASLFDGFVSGNFVMPASQIWIACVYGQLLARPGTGVRQPRFANVGCTLSVMLLASQLWLLVIAPNQVAHPEPRVPYPNQSHLNTANPKPRFWLNGQL